MATRSPKKPAAKSAPPPAPRSTWKALLPTGPVPEAGLRSRLDAVPQALVAPLPLHGKFVHRIALGPDGVAYSAGEDGRVLAFDARTLAVRREFTGHDGPVNTLALSEDGRTLVTGGDDQTVRVWEAATGVCQRVLSGHEGYVRQVAVRGDRIASGSEDDLLKLWSVSDGILLATVAHPNDVMAVALSPDGRLVATSSLSNTVRLHDATTGAPVRTLYDAQATVSKLKGMNLFMATDNRTGLGHPQTPTHLRFSADSQTLYSAEKTTLAWDLRAGSVRTAAPSGGFTTTSLALHGELLATGSYGVRLFDAATAAPRGFVAQGVNQISALCFDGDALLVGQENGQVSRWPVPQATPTSQPHAGAIREVHIDAQSRRAAVSDMFNVVSLWDLATGTCMQVFDDLPQANGSAVAFSPDGERLATSSETALRVWSAATGEPLHTLAYDGDASFAPSALAFEPGGTLLVGSAMDALTRWHLDGTGHFDKLKGRTGQVSALWLSDDGRVALGRGYFEEREGADSSAKLQLWDLEAAKLRWTRSYPAYSGEAPQPSLSMAALSADGETVWASDPAARASIAEWSAAAGKGPTHPVAADFGQGRLLLDGRLWLATGSTDDAHPVLEQTLEFWTKGSARPTRAAVPKGQSVVALSADGEVALLQRERDRVTFWSTSRGEALGHLDLDAPVNEAALAPDGRVAVVGDELGRVWIVGR